MRRTYPARSQKGSTLCPGAIMPQCWVDNGGGTHERTRLALPGHWSGQNTSCPSAGADQGRGGAGALPARRSEAATASVMETPHGRLSGWSRCLGSSRGGAIARPSFGVEMSPGRRGRDGAGWFRVWMWRDVEISSMWEMKGPEHLFDTVWLQTDGDGTQIM